MDSLVTVIDKVDVDAESEIALVRFEFLPPISHTTVQIVWPHDEVLPEVGQIVVFVPKFVDPTKSVARGPGT